MTCKFKDGVRIEYSGSLCVRKGAEISGFLVKGDSMPDTLKVELDRAARSENCKEMRRLSDAIVNGSPCGKICL